MRKIQQSDRHRVTVLPYGAPKTGKTRLTAACNRGLEEQFGEQSLYICVDPDSTDLMLSGMLPEDAERMIPIQPVPDLDSLKGEPLIIGKKPAGNYSPLMEAQLIATYNWQREYPNVKTIIIDTFTEWCELFLMEAALLEAAPADAKEGRVAFGRRGKVEFHVSPSRSDYLVAQGLTMRVIRNLLNQPMNVICVFHEAYVESINRGGPAAIGKALVQSLPGKFQHTVHLTSKKDKFMAHNSNHGVFLAGGRSPSAKPMQDLQLNADPVNFWVEYGKALRGELK